MKLEKCKTKAKKTSGLEPIVVLLLTILSLNICSNYQEEYFLQNTFPISEDIAFKSDTIEYKHDGSENFHDSFTIQISDTDPLNPSNTLILIQQLNISISEIDDEIPLLVASESLVLKPGTKRCLDSANLQASDSDTNIFDIKYILHNSPRFGDLTILTNQGREKKIGYGDSFTQFDVDEGFVCYIGFDDVTEAGDAITFDLTDGSNVLRDQVLNISIKSSFQVGANFTVVLSFQPDKGDIPLNTANIVFSDITIDVSSLQFIVNQAPKRGDVKVLRNKIYETQNSFSVRDLMSNLVIYYHDITFEDNMDSFQLQLVQIDTKWSLGDKPDKAIESRILRTYNVAIIDPLLQPILVTLQPLTVAENASLTLTTDEIKVEQDGEIVEEVEFYVNQNPFWGSLFNRNFPQNKIIKFSMQDLIKGDINYKHSGRDVRTIRYDVIGLKLADSRRPSSDFWYYVMPNTTTKTKNNLNIIITLLPVDNRPPKIYINSISSDIIGITNMKSDMSLSNGNVQFSGVPINAVNLKAIDPDTFPSDVIFDVTRSPSKGFLCRRFIGTFLSNFSQSDIDNRKVGYCLPHGSTHHEDSFGFELKDRSKFPQKSMIPLKCACNIMVQ